MKNGGGKKRTAKTIETGGIKSSPLINPIDYESINFRNAAIRRLTEAKPVTGKLTKARKLKKAKPVIGKVSSNYGPAPRYR
tara:strand:+ start:965 stop:1207 length:243 start_codon:yes stop_codon:yes gene_type:complete